MTLDAPWNTGRLKETKESRMAISINSWDRQMDPIHGLCEGHPVGTCLESGAPRAMYFLLGSRVSQG